MIIKESFGYVRSDRALHFTEALQPEGSTGATASEYENLTFDLSRTSVPGTAAAGTDRGNGRCKIVSLTLQVATKVDFAVDFYSRRNSGLGSVPWSAATPYENTFLGRLYLDGQDAWPVGTEYRYQTGIGQATQFHPVYYYDDDNLNELHVALINVDGQSRTKVSIDGKNGVGGAAPVGLATPYVTMKIGYVKVS